MTHMARVYAINVLWVTERILEGWMETVYEKTSAMLAKRHSRISEGFVPSSLL